ncbi:sulfotransferase family 2 domain-containing protein [Sulfitobacter sp.]|uniref:sulfotransferase family 2 domain-containing protein n=1 Tax=Sulfitobacter sp. TaxID=1903071 RepID=UPI0039E2D31D
MPLAKINGRLLHFIHIPKTGGSAVSSYLRAKGPMALYSRERVDWSKSTPQHIELATQNVLIPDGFADHCFAILRDPFDRLLSEYRYRALRRNQVENLPDSIGPSDKLTVEFDWDAAFHGTFDEWVREIFSGQASDPYLCDNHVRPQADFIGRAATVFLFEDGLEQVFNWIDHVTDTERAAVKLDRNASSQFAIEMLDTTRKMISTYYHEDFLLIEKTKAARASKFASRI